MKRITKFIWLLFLLSVCILCKQRNEKAQYSTGKGPLLTDRNATSETKALYQLLLQSSKKGFFVGHQDATAYGIGWEHEQGNYRSDIKSVCNEYPAVYGWDLGHIETGSQLNIDSLDFDLIRELIIEADRRGGIITISWHAKNPVTGESSWTEKETIPYILTDDSIRAKFFDWTDTLAAFIRSLKNDKGQPIPVIFRPWHEWNGDWFWWGKPHCTPEEYIEFWKLTVESLRDRNQLHNLLYAFSPNAFYSKEEYLERFPEGFVDILGFDIYVYDNQVNKYKETLSENLRQIREIADEKKRIFALTETGYEGIPENNWFTESLYPVIKNSGIAWVLFWRNANTKHHYAPYPGHGSADDFQKFYQYQESLFEYDVRNIKR